MTKLYVCIGSACHLKGSYNVICNLQSLIEERALGDLLQVEAVFCLGCCTRAVSVRVGDGEVHSVSASDTAAFFDWYVLPLLTPQD